MVECTGLENQRGLTPSVGSNPTSSATTPYKLLLFIALFGASVPNYLKNSHPENDASDRDLPLERFYNARQRTALFKRMATRCLRIPSCTADD